MNIATFTDHIATPSSRFRIRQYFPRLKASGIYVHDYYRKFSTETAADVGGNQRIRQSIKLLTKAILHESANILHSFFKVVDSYKYDAVWLSRQLIIGYPSFEFFIKKPLIYDIDDAIFLSGKSSYIQFKITSQRACVVIAGNSFLADAVVKHNKNIFIVPTAVDTERWFPPSLAKINYDTRLNEFRIGWSGTSSSFKYFLPLQGVFRHFFHDYPSSKLLIMSDRFPYELKDLGPHFEFLKWNTNDEVSFVQSLDVGLMPMENDLWSQGKCSYKMLLYAACGIPVIVAPVGSNKTILEEADIGFGPIQPSGWYEAMELLFKDRSIGRKFGENGVKLVQDRYSVNVCAPIIEKIIRSCS